MQEASVHFSTSGHMTDNKAVPETSPVKSLPCSRCTLIFKSRVYLFEHLNIVHSLDVDTALKEAGLKHHETVTVCTGNKRINLGNFQCQHCDFKACSQENLTEHEMKCKKIANQNGIVNPAFPENQETEIIVISTEQHKEGAGAKESLSDKSTNHKSKCPVNTSKDLKTYKRPLQTITKYFLPSSGSQGKSSLKLSENPRPVESREMQETLILKESPSCSSPESSGVFKVTAKSMIDISKQGSHRFLLDDHFVISDLTPPEPVEKVTKNPPNKWGKRRNDEEFGSAAKKAKFSQKQKMLPEEAKEKEHQSSSNTEFLFEISEDEEEKMANLLNEDTENPKLYFCKQCNYSDMGTKAISIHYRNHHPYVKYNVSYIKDQSDQSATFRCLECPVEFLNVADLKRHYAENHPEAPNVFSKQLFELKMAFKCFVCPFTSNVLNLLKRHYKENHPNHKVNNSLCYYRYSVAQEEEVKNAQSPQHPTSKGSDTVLYNCNNCQFSHKSAVVMHVHYQKTHPDEEVTIDKIKQSVNVTSQITPKKSVTVTENNTPQNNILDSSEKATKLKISLSLKRKCTPDASNTESPKPEKVKAAKEGSKTKTTKSNRKTPAATDNSSPSSPDKLFYCQFCSYSSTNVKSVAAHHKVKHAEHGLRDTEDILRYSADVRKKGQSKTEASEEDNVRDASNPYACAENLFYCQKCNFGNPTLKGVVNHQNKAHQRINTNLETILEHTALIRDEIKKLKTAGRASSTNLPLPVLNKGDEVMQFCPVCNYRHNTMERMLRHCVEAHRGAQIKSPQIQRYTLEVLKQAQNSLLQTTASQAAKNASLVGKGKKKKTTTKMRSKGLPVSASPSVRATKTRGNFKCYRCPFRAQCLSVLRRHMWKSHKSNRSVHEILQVLYKHGSVQSGYHCDTCVFSDEAATVVQKHFEEQHPERKMTFEYILRRLYVGPNKDPPEDKNAKIKHIDAVSKGASTDGSLLSQRSGQNETKRHSCRACPFRGSSMSSLANHYRAVHPWTVKDDGSVLNVITREKLSENSDVEEHNEMQGTIVNQEVPPGSGTESPSSVKCRYCPAIFNTPHGLQTHYGMKHIEACKSSAKQAQVTQTRVHVFNCPHCTYINTNYHGVLTHCQMKHPALPASVDSTHVDGKLVPSLKDKDGKSVKFKGYVCETCPQILATLEKFNKHREKDHNDTVQNALKPALKPLVIRNLQQSNNHISQGSVSKASFLSKKKFARIKCQQCNYTCTNKLALSRHVQLQHRNASNAALKGRHYEYKCNLCFSPYLSEKYLENHYIRKHGKDAFLKYCAEVGKHVPEEPDPNTPMGEQRVMVFKCPRCPYVNACTHGILTHCQMRHPAVVARADELKRDEIVVSNMVGCKKGRSSNERGYKCKNCSQVYATLMKLKVHQEKKHKKAGQAASERVADTEKQAHFDSDYSVLEALALKNQSDSLGTAVETRNADLSQQPTSSEKCQVSLENEKSEYKCTMCPYVGICRKYLHCHYKNSHKLDPLTTYKLLVKYTKRKCISLRYLHKAMLRESAQVKCKKCPDLMFDSSQLLIAHYSVFHCKMDFTVLSEPSKNYGGVYRCAHCRKKIRGIGKLWHHLDRHAAKEKKKAKVAKAAKAANAPPVITTTPEATSFEPGLEEEPPILETVEELAPLSVTPEESFDFPTRQDKHRCKPCGRNFNSLKGLRLHERSHAALAAIKKLNHLPTSVQKQSIDKYLLYKSGTLRPFVCVICSFRTTVLDLWRTHFTKKHQDAIVDSAETDNQDKEEAHMTRMEPPNLSEDHNYLAEPKEEPDVADESLYLEPPDVQRQLNNYNLVAQTSNLQQTAMLENSLLHCESCTFSTGHISSLRRHYANRHGKKILKCRDCDFFTGSRKILDMHVEMGHSDLEAQATQQRFLRCPFCLYQTRTKNSMIDHIVLHRDERLVPIEVRRSKLSRYLRGVVFRCHKCTFTSGTAENLRLHMIKHDDIKPYKCRLCYFDCALLSDLEAHLSDKHQVMRNHDLVGQVSLDKLELVSVGTMTKEEEAAQEETSSNFEPHNNDSEDVETEEFSTDRNEINHETQAENLAESSIEETTTVQMKESSQDLQGQEGSMDLSDNAGGQRMEDAESANIADIQSDECSSRERDGNQAQPQERHCEDSGVISPQQKEEAAGGSSTTCGKITVRMEAHKLNEEELQQRTLNIEERVENDILRHILLLDKDEDDELPKAEQDRAMKTEESTMSGCRDDTLHESPDEGGSIVASCNSKLEVDPESKRNHAHANNERFKVDRHLLTLSPNRVQLMISHNIKSSKTVSLTNEEHARIQTHSEEMTDPYGEMPVLENEYLKDHPTPLGSCKEEEDEMVTEDSGDRCKDQEHKEEDEISAHKSSDTATSVAAEVLCPSVTEIKLYTCELCGRNLKDSSELTRHVMRHGL